LSLITFILSSSSGKWPSGQHDGLDLSAAAFTAEPWKRDAQRNFRAALRGMGEPPRIHVAGVPTSRTGNSDIVVRHYGIAHGFNPAFVSAFPLHARTGSISSAQVVYLGDSF
jgi:hypothetical protein